MDPLDWKKVIKDVRLEAHQVYLDNWETKTQVAENDGNWNQDIQHRVLASIEDLSSSLDMFASALDAILELNPSLKFVEPS